MDKILILGNGGHAKSIIDVLKNENRYEIVGCIGKKDSTYSDSEEDLQSFFASGITNVAIGIGYLGNSSLREELYFKLKKIGFHFPCIVSSTALIGNHVTIGEGCFIGKGAIINAYSEIGKMCIVNTGAIIEHESKIGDYSHVAVGCVLCGNVRVGKSSFIGANSTIIQDVAIGQNCIIGAGALIRKKIEDYNEVYTEMKMYQCQNKAKFL